VAILKETYPVLGMECASCVRKIETVLGNTEGIKNAAINFATENLTVEYDDQIINPRKISDIIQKLGYEMVT